MAVKNKEGLFAPGTYDFKKVAFRDHDGLDLRFKTLEINIYESIFQPCMTADITIIDAENHVANLPIVEGDVMDIELVPNSEDSIQQNTDDPNGIKCAMEVIKITSRAKTTHQDVQVYNLRLASVGWSNNMRTRLSRSFVQEPYSDMVQKIFDDKFKHPEINGLQGKFEKSDFKELKKDKTYGDYTVIIPRWKPITCFNWLAGRSQAADNPSAVNYLFWEDKENYNFKSVDGLMKKEPEVTFYVKLQNISKDDPKNYTNIFSYSYEDTGDILLYGMNGTFGSRLITHDIVSKQVYDHFGEGFYSFDYNVTEEPFDYVEEFENIAHTDKNPLITDEVSETLSDDPGNTRLFVQNKHMFNFIGVKDNKPEQWLRQRTMQKPMLKYIRLTINTVGYFKVKAGDMINIELPSPEEEKGVKDKRLTGKYLVTNVRRIFKPTKHQVVMEVIKDSLNG